MPCFWDLVHLSTETPLQLPVSRTLLKQSHNFVFHSTPQHPNLHPWCLGVDSSKTRRRCVGGRENCCPSEIVEKWCRENSVDFSTPSVKQISDFFMYLYQDLNRCPSTIDGYRTAIIDTLAPTGLHISQRSDLNWLLCSFTGIVPKVPGIFLVNGTFLLFSMSSQKHPLSL